VTRTRAEINPKGAAGGALPGALVGEGLALQGDGRLVLARSVIVGSGATESADFALMRLNGDGSADTTFGNGFGVLKVDFFGFADLAESVLVQPDGKIVLGGVAESSVDGYGLARLLP